MKAPRRVPSPSGKRTGTPVTPKRPVTEPARPPRAVPRLGVAEAGAAMIRPPSPPAGPFAKRVGRKPLPASAPQTGLQLHTADGLRKYLTASERDAFLRAAEQADRPVRTLCMTLAYAGCRLSEALALTADRVDLAADVLVFESLKKRRTRIFRSVPVPPALLDTLDMVHGIRELKNRRGKGRARGSGRGRG